MKNISNTKHLLVGQYGKINDPDWKYEILKASTNEAELVEKMNKIDIGTSKYAVIKILAPHEEF